MLPQLEPLSRALTFAQERFVYGLQQVPADRLDWNVGGSANSPLKIAGKAAGMLGFIAAAVQARSMPERPSGGFPAPPETAEAAIQAVNGSYQALQSAIASLTEEDLPKKLRAPWGQELALSDWIAFTNQVAGYWQGQLNLTQLAYGDEKPNIPPQFGGDAGH
jgi:hypothetical protein